ncbi:hypothetical protein FLA_3667 [Filimonas lacunae]|nr:hypothetical protein FLA_3667 [Filimonas lacunae]
MINATVGSLVYTSSSAVLLQAKLSPKQVIRAKIPGFANLFFLVE